jgi:beta-glucanase (GH16 family)
MINSHLGFLAAALVVLRIPIADAASAETSGSCELRPVFIEDFNEDTAPNRRIESMSAHRIGPARWTTHTPWSGDFGDAAFLDPEPERPFKIKDGILSITASKDQQGKWTSGLLAAADATGAGKGTRYGYFEARMKMPPGPGTWPAFWLVSLIPQPATEPGVEIDVLEYYGHITDAYASNLHVWHKGKETLGVGTKIDVPNGALVADYHTYGVDVSPQAIVFFHDGKRVWTQPTPPELTAPLYPLVNLALGSGWPIDKTPNPSTLLVDYVHVYGRDAGPPQGCPAGPPTSR